MQCSYAAVSRIHGEKMEDRVEVRLEQSWNHAELLVAEFGFVDTRRSTPEKGYCRATKTHNTYRDTSRALCGGDIPQICRSWKIHTVKYNKMRPRL